MSLVCRKIWPDKKSPAAMTAGDGCCSVIFPKGTHKLGYFIVDWLTLIGYLRVQNKHPDRMNFQIIILTHFGLQLSGIDLQ
ncbi:hypothetical protein Xkoz_01951 [Xenorhabdus kozodoii]|uniref:Uncharacterized protein n=1 Tax=Xenorhabdus kozodoii TaxID=351676 RepID=A0A2D0LC81_9GAMM|nr:hypothetical protein Xkoz_01951 [Xenorhabdus kozodoii]